MKTDPKISDDCFNSGAFKMGEAAFKEGKKISDNPYDESDCQFSRWKSGYEYAQAATST